MSINLSGIMVSFIKRVATDVSQGHSLHIFFLTTILENLCIPIVAFDLYTTYDAIDYLETRGIHRIDPGEDVVVGLKCTDESVPSIIVVGSTGNATLSEL